MSISNAYVELLGGKLLVESSPGTGSKFSFRIPFRKTSNPVAEFETGAGSKSNESVSLTKTILVAEDEESNFALVNAILSPQGYKIIRAKNGETAIDLCRSKTEIDLILMDIKMPIVDGFDATREILKFRPRLPIIAQTAYAHPADKTRALETGCVDYLAKPFSRSQLIEVIQKYLK